MKYFSLIINFFAVALYYLQYSNVNSIIKRQYESVLPWYACLIISSGVFVLSVVSWKIAKTNWAHTIIISYSFATIAMVIAKPYRSKENGEYDIDIITIIETTMIISSIALSLFLNIYQGCRANKQHTCCVCCHIPRDVSGPYLFDDAMWSQQEKPEETTLL